MLLFQQSDLVGRDHFGHWLNQRGLTGEAAEIGTHRGDWANILLDVWQGKKLYCIDHWEVPVDYANQAKYLWGSTNREEDLLAAREILGKYEERVQILRATSCKASEVIGNNSLDFVYVDGDHSCRGVSQDLELWWPKLKPGGILAGHDIICPGESLESEANWGRYIQPVVINFAAEKQATIFLVVEMLCSPWSYYLVKN